MTAPTIEQDLNSIRGDQWPGREFPLGPRERPTRRQVIIKQSVLNDIHLHGRGAPEIEVCGVLVGNVYQDAMGPFVYIEASIRGNFSAGHAAQVTFTAKTWQHIQDVLDRDYPDLRILGWYHTHPGHGIFLSDMDLFIQQNFFSLPWHVAFVFDPKAGEEGLFAWRAGHMSVESFVVKKDVPQDPEPVAKVIGDAAAILAATAPGGMGVSAAPGSGFSASPGSAFSSMPRSPHAPAAAHAVAPARDVGAQHAAEIPAHWEPEVAAHPDPEFAEHGGDIHGGGMGAFTSPTIDHGMRSEFGAASFGATVAAPTRLTPPPLPAAPAPLPLSTYGLPPEALSEIRSRLQALEQQQRWVTAGLALLAMVAVAWPLLLAAYSALHGSGEAVPSAMPAVVSTDAAAPRDAASSAAREEAARKLVHLPGDERN
jgi:proteasome lid subunit RPN8/RPN11